MKVRVFLYMTRAQVQSCARQGGARPFNPGPPISVGLEALPNFYQDHNELSECRQKLTVFQGQIKHIVQITDLEQNEHPYGQ
jgi:hypothetical protein